MGILSWIIVGAISGGIASYVMNKDNKQGCIANTVIGIVGALVGGFVVSFIGGKGVTGFNLWSLIVATFGSILFIWIIRKITG